MCNVAHEELAERSLGASLAVPLHELFYHEMAAMTADGKGGFGTRSLQTYANLLLAWRSIPLNKHRRMYPHAEQQELCRALVGLQKEQDDKIDFVVVVEEMERVVRSFKDAEPEPEITLLGTATEECLRACGITALKPAAPKGEPEPEPEPELEPEPEEAVEEGADMERTSSELLMMRMGVKADHQDEEKAEESGVEGYFHSVRSPVIGESGGGTE